MLFYPTHCLRRLVFVYICLFMKDYPSLQIMYAMFLNMFILIYIGSFKPLGTVLQNRIELFNEFLICNVTFLILNFTDWVGDKPIRVMYGWVMNILVFVIIGFNSSFILYFGGRSISMLFTKYKNRLVYRFKIFIQNFKK